MLEIKNLYKSYGKKEVIKGINIRVEAGEIFGFIGHNGAGKTTTIKSLVGILPFEKGQILIDGSDIAKDPIACKNKMAYIPDNPDLYEYMTAIDYLKFVGSIFEMSTNDLQNEVERLAKDFEIYDKLNDQIKSYSHGMKQKLAIISALMHKPKLLVLDEPFVGLDPKASYILKNKMKEMCEMGGSIFFSTHVLEVVEKLCDHVAILKDGNITIEGRTEDIMANGTTLEEVFLGEENERV